MPNVLDRIIDFLFPHYGEQRRKARAMLTMVNKTEPTRRRIISPGLESSGPQYIDIAAFSSAHFTNCHQPSHIQAVQHSAAPAPANTEPIKPPECPRRRDFDHRRPMARGKIE